MLYYSPGAPALGRTGQPAVLFALLFPHHLRALSLYSMLVCTEDKCGRVIPRVLLIDLFISLVHLGYLTI